MQALPLWAVLHFALAAIGTSLARHYALRRQLLDQPGERRSHAQATPRGGGIAIVAAMLAGAGWLGLHGGDAFAHMALGCFVLGLVLVAGIGWLDDHKPMSPWPRLAIHAIAAALLAWVAWLATGQAWLALCVLIATMALINLWNFMDGINGLAASQAALAALLPALLLHGAGAWLALALLAACSGFLPFNFPNARIFLGDVGSGALGFVLAALLLFGVLEFPPALPSMLLPLMPFVVDAGLTLVWRMWRGERWWTPHVEHAYQRLARRFGHVPVTVGFTIVTVVGVVLGHVGLGLDSPRRMLLVTFWYGLGTGAWCWMRRRKA